MRLQATMVLSVLISSAGVSADIPQSAARKMYGDYMGHLCGRFGTSLDADQDFSGDGVADIVIGAPGTPALEAPGIGCDHPGYVSLWVDEFQVDASDAPAFDDGSLYGWVVDAIRDVSGDGQPDVIVAEPRYQPAAETNGRVRIISGGNLSSIIATWTPPDANLLVGFTLAVIDESVPGEVLFATSGEVGERPEFGKVYLLRYASGVFTTVETFVGSDFAHQVVRSVHNVGDLNADGIDEIGIMYTSTLMGNEGETMRVFDGANPDPLAPLWSVTDSDWGREVAPVSDINNDGVPDIVMGIRISSGAASDRAADIISGADGELLLTLRFDSATAMSRTVATGVDQNRPCVRLVLVGRAYEGATLFELTTAFLEADQDGADQDAVAAVGRVCKYAVPTVYPFQQILCSFIDGINFGVDVEMGDVDGDGDDDAIIGAISADINCNLVFDEETGAAYQYDLHPTDFDCNGVGGEVTDLSILQAYIFDMDPDNDAAADLDCSGEANVLDIVRFIELGN